MDIGEGYVFYKRYRLLQELTSDGQLRVFLVEDTHENMKNKVIKMVESLDVMDTKRLIDLLETLDSPYLIKFFDDFSFYKIKHCIVTEYYPHENLAQKINAYNEKNEKINNKRLNLWNLQIMEGIYYLHSSNIIHREITPENIFITERDDLKIGDSGYWRNLNYSQTNLKMMSSINYMSPELLKGDMKYDEKVDIWAYGCVLYEMITQEKLFKEMNETKLFKLIEQTQINIPDTTQLYESILTKSLVKNKNNRASIFDLKDLIPENENLLNIKKQNKTNQFKLAGGSSDNSIKLWNADNGQFLMSLKEHANAVLCMTRIDANRLISGSSDRTLKLWHLERANCTRTFRGHYDSVYCVVLVDENRIASGSSDNTIKVWNITDENCTHTLRGHNGTVSCLAVFNSNRKILSGSYDRTIKIWNLNTAECLKTLNEHTYTITTLKVTNNNEFITASGDGKIKVWNFDTDRSERTLRVPGLSVTCTFIVNLNKIVVGHEFGEIKIWNIPSSICLKTLLGHEKAILCVEVYNCDTRMISACFDRVVKIWDIEAETCLNTLDEHKNVIRCLTVLHESE